MTATTDTTATRTTTYLFTDIEASTAAWETTRDMSGRLQRHLTILEDAVDTGGGTVFATMGDGIAAAFPSAHAAVRAAVTAQRSLPASGLRSRMGLHTGEAERVGTDHRGRAVNRAARIMAVGHGGQILLSDVTASIVRSGPAPVTLLDLGTHRLRDLADPERLWQVGVPAAGDGPDLAPTLAEDSFLGRAGALSLTAARSSIALTRAAARLGASWALAGNALLERVDRA